LRDLFSPVWPGIRKGLKGEKATIQQVAKAGHPDMAEVRPPGSAASFGKSDPILRNLAKRDLNDTHISGVVRRVAAYRICGI
jgi:hypothetical protein